MKLKDRSQTPVGGFYYDDPTFGTIFTDGNFDSLVRMVKTRYAANNTPVPNGIESLIEDQICHRQPPGRCRYTKALGDIIANTVQGVAGAVDSVAGTTLRAKAKGCGGCAKRRAKLNALTSR